MKSVEDLHQKIKNLHGLVATDSVSGGHQKIADREQAAATFWRHVAVGSIGCAIVWLLCTLFYLTPTLYPERLFWLQIGKSISLTALLLTLAVYASKQAALHRTNERRFRSFFLQVQAFDPFIESLSEADKQELKKALSERIFGPDEAKTDDAVLDQPSLNVVKELMAGLAKIKP